MQKRYGKNKNKTKQNKNKFYYETTFKIYIITKKMELIKPKQQICAIILERRISTQIKLLSIYVLYIKLKYYVCLLQNYHTLTRGRTNHKKKNEKK